MVPICGCMGGEFPPCATRKKTKAVQRVLVGIYLLGELFHHRDDVLARRFVLRSILWGGGGRSIAGGSENNAGKDPSLGHIIGHIIRDSYIFVRGNLLGLLFNCSHVLVDQLLIKAQGADQRQFADCWACELAVFFHLARGGI